MGGESGGELDATPQPAGQARPRWLRPPAARLAGRPPGGPAAAWPGPCVGPWRGSGAVGRVCLGGPWGGADEQPDGQVGAVRAGREFGADDRRPGRARGARIQAARAGRRTRTARTRTARGDREAGQGGGDVGLEVGVVLRIGRRRARGQRRQPGPVHRDRHRAGHVDHHGARIADRGRPHLPGRGGHRPGFRPPAHQRRQRGEGQQRGPPVPPDQGGKGQLPGRPVVAAVIVGITGRTGPARPDGPIGSPPRSPRRPRSPR